MALSTNFYYDGADLQVSTKLFMDKLGLIPAPNGFYKEGGIVREYVDGAFVSSDLCDCPNSCDYIAELTDSNRVVYDANFNVGTSTGAIVLRATPSNKNFGMSAVYNSVTYKNVYVQGSMLTTAGDFVIWGVTPSFTENCPSQFTNQTYNNVKNYVMSGNVFNPVSNIPTITANANQVFNTGFVIGMIIIPKSSAVINDVSVRWYGLCPNFDATIEGNCVESLTPFEIYSDPYETQNGACAGSIKASTTFYCVKRNPSEPTIQSFDVAFEDANAMTVMPAGYYIYQVGVTNTVIQIGNDGIILSINECK